MLDPHPANPKDAPRWIAEAHKRLSAPLTALSYMMVALCAVLTGAFRRHGGLLRPLASVGAMVGLVALQLVVGDMAARNNALLGLIWAQAVLPGVVGRLAAVRSDVARARGAGPLGDRARRARRARMTAAVTLSLYIVRQFLAAVLAMLAALTALVSLFDFIELLRRSVGKADATFALVSEIAALRLPYIAMEILPFAVLVGGIVCFWRLTRSSELIVARAAGVSAWQFLAAPVMCALLLGALATTAISPLSSVMFARAEALQQAHLRWAAARSTSRTASSGCASPIAGWSRMASRSCTPARSRCTARR